MAKFQVPQFIEEKSKIVGPFTLTQFIYIASAGALSVASFYLFGGFLWFLITILAGALAISLAFIKINGQSLPLIIVSALKFWQKPKTYVWKRETEYTTIDSSALERIKSLRRDMSLQERIKNATLGVVTGAVPFLDKKSKSSKKGGEERQQVVTYATGEKGIAKRVDY